VYNGEQELDGLEITREDRRKADKLPMPQMQRPQRHGTGKFGSMDKKTSFLGNVFFFKKGEGELCFFFVVCAEMVFFPCGHVESCL